ncbi:hypothetical protein LM594_02735 [Candidatus Caldipriscus sp.]|nr:hypothetical protein [Candidatus Caldipriscus sp.]
MSTRLYVGNLASANPEKGIFEPYININPTDNYLDDTVAVLRFQTNTGCTTVSGTVIASEPTTSYVFAMLSDPTGWIDFYVSSNRGSSWTYRRSWQSGPSFTRFFSVSSKVGATRGTMFSFVEINDATDLITGADNKYYILYAEWGSSPDTFRLWWFGSTSGYDSLTGPISNAFYCRGDCSSSRDRSWL